MPDPVSTRRGFLAELKRRRVLRVAGAYLAASFVGLQGADYLFRALQLPEWAFRVVVFAVLVGFVIALPVAWVYDLGPEGIHRTRNDYGGSGGLGGVLKIGAVVAAAAVIAAGGGWLALRGRGAATSVRRIVVPAFENRTGDPALDPLGDMAADWLAQGLAESGFVEVVDASTAIAVSRRSQARTEADEEPVRLVSRETGARFVVVGRYYADRDSVRFVASVVDAESGRLLRAVGPVAAARSAPVDGAERLRQRLISELAVLLDERLARFQPLDTRPPAYPAYREFIQGLSSYLLGSFGDARVRFSHAFALDSSFRRALLWAGQATLWEDTAADGLQRYDSLAALLGRARDRLSPAEQHQLDFMDAFRHHDLRAAYSAARLRSQAVPGSDDATRELALSAGRIYRFREELELLRRLDPYHGLLRVNPGYWHYLGQTQHALGDFRGELRSASELERLFPLSSWVDASRIAALSALGRGDDVRPLAFAAAERLEGDPASLQEQRSAEGPYAFAGAFVSAAAPFELAARELSAHGFPAQARQIVGSGVAWCAARPASDRDDPMLRIGCADLLTLAGRWRDADTLLARTRVTAQTQAGLLALQGIVAARLGDRPRATALSRVLGELPVRNPGNAMYDPLALELRRACISAALGDRDDVLRHLRAWRAAGDWAPERVHAEPSLLPYLHDADFRRLLAPED